MEIVNVRVDERLVHGMVSAYWIPALKVDRVVCLDDASAASPAIKQALRMATPGNVFLSVITVAKFLDNVKLNKYGNERVMVVTKKPSKLVELIESGIKFPEVIIGNLGVLKRATDSVQITNFILLDTDDRSALDELHGRGIEIYGQMLPTDARVDIYQILK